MFLPLIQNCQVARAIVKWFFLFGGEKMPKLVIFLNRKEEDALVKLAEREFRDPRSQAAYIIREALKNLGLISIKISDNNLSENINEG